LRADLAPFAVDLLLALAGLGVLASIGLVPRRASAMVAALGLAYLTGTAVVPLVLIVLLVIGIPFTIETFVVVVLACIGIGALRAHSGPEEREPARQPWWRQPWRSWPIEVWVAGACIGLFVLFVTVGLLSALRMPLDEWDAWSIWARKAQMLTLYDSLASGFWTGSSYSWIHLDYPLQLPVWEAIHFRAGGAFETQALLRHVWLLLGAFIWAVAYLFRGQVRPIVWAPLLLLVAVTPGIWDQLLTGYADVPMAIFASLGAISLALWLSEEDGRSLALAAVMLAAAANTKNEGLMAAVALLLVAGAIAWRRKLGVRHFLYATGVVVAAILPWRIWSAAHDIKGDLPVSKTITDPGYLFDRADRIWPSVETIATELANQGRWLYLLPLAALMVAAALISGFGRRVAAFYLASFFLVWAGLVWSYWISPNPLDWHLGTSASRVVSVLMLICVAATVHLTGRLFNAHSAQRHTESDLAPDSASSPPAVGDKSEIKII
jgi:hypothetical protein